MASIVFLRKKKRWRVFWYRKDVLTGEVLRGSRVFPDRESARAFGRVMDQQMADKESGQIVVCLSDALAAWSREKERFTAQTWCHYQSCMDRFVESLPSGGQSNLTDLGTTHLHAFIFEMRKNQIKNRTVNATVTPVLSFFRWAAQVYKISNPIAGFRMLPEMPPESRFLTDEEFRRTLELGGPVYTQRALFIANTGVRADEFCGLMFDEVPVNREHYGYLTMSDTMLCVVGKCRKRRFIPLNETCRRLVAELRSQSGSSPYMFLSKSTSYHNKLLTRQALYHMCSDVAQKCGIRTFGPHALRHLFATRLLTSGVDVAKVARIMGHASIQVTEKVYAHWLPGHLSGATDCLDRYP